MCVQSNQVGDEEHSFLVYGKYKDLRFSLFTKLYLKITDLNQIMMNVLNCFLMMNSGCAVDTTFICKLIQET